jgi:rare lipoprotein A
LIVLCTLLFAMPALAAPASLRASYYHPKFNGRPMACGGVYSDHRYTAASNHHACGTLVEVSHGGRSVVAEVTDRCGRCGIDLSRAAAREIGLINRGTASVRVKVIDD